MRADAYVKRLGEDLERWVKDGLIDQTTAQALEQDARARAISNGSSPILASMAGLVVGLGVLTVIAANWSALTGVMRLALVGLLISLCLLSAGYLRDRKVFLVSNILSAFGVLLVGGGIVVIGQLYHTQSTSAAFFSLWTLIGLGLTLALRSPLAGAGTALLALMWTTFHISESNTVATVSGPLWVVPVLAALVVAGWQWRAIGMLNIVFLTIIYWVSWTLADTVLEGIYGVEDFRIAFLLAGFWGLIGVLAELAVRTTNVFALRTISGWCSWALALFVLVGLAAERVIDGPYVMVAAGLSLALFAALTAYGAAPGRRWIRAAGVFGFIGGSITIFTYSTNLVTAGFTLIVFGTALIGLLMITNRMHKKAQERAS